MENLRDLQQRHAVIGDVRGKGLFCGAELVADRTTREPLTEPLVQQVIAECQARGVLIGSTARALKGFNNTLCLAPALCVSADEIDQITGTLDAALGAVLG